MKKQLVLLGAPGSGKGTQAALIVERFGYNHLSTGDLLRSEIASESDLGLRVKSIMDSGNLVDDATVLELLKSRCDVENSAYIFDGYPRNIEQAEALEVNVLNGTEQVALYFDVDLDKLVERIVNRRSCVKCGTIYNLINNTPTTEGICDSCGGELKHRKDDREDVVKNRIDIFKDKVIPVKDYYKKAGVLKVIDASKSVEEIFSEITELVK